MEFQIFLRMDLHPVCIMSTGNSSSILGHWPCLLSIPLVHEDSGMYRHPPYILYFIYLPDRSIDLQTFIFTGRPLSHAINFASLNWSLVFFSFVFFLPCIRCCLYPGIKKRHLKERRKSLRGGWSMLWIYDLNHQASMQVSSWKNTMLYFCTVSVHLRRLI
jgi:hypothetical protein